MNIAGKRVLITGGSSGIGLAVAAATSIGGAFTASITLTLAAPKAGGSGGA